MGGKAGTSRASAGPELAAIRETLFKLMREAAPAAELSEKWGMTHFSIGNSLFALAANNKQVSCYILIPGFFARYASELGHLPQSSCCLRFPVGASVPIATMRLVLGAAVKEKTNS